jgi:hypothetical protein
MRVMLGTDVNGELPAAGEKAIIFLAANRLAHAVEIAGTHRLSPHRLGALPDRLDDILVTGASTQISLELGAYGFFVGIGMALHEIDCGEHHAGRTKTALQSVAVLERGLHRVQLAVSGGETFDGGYLRSIRLRGENRARLDRIAIDQDRAGTALTGVATDVRAGEAEIIANEIDQQRTRIDVGGCCLAVDRK